MPPSRTLLAGIFSLGILAAYVALPSLLPQTQDERRRRHTTGLVNTGNDCYANSTFQALSSLRVLADYLNVMGETEARPWTQRLADVLSDLRQEDDTPRHSSIWPALHTLEALVQARMSRGQQDAHEFLLKVLELLEKEYDREIAEFPFRGVVTDTIQCKRCGQTTKKNTEFLVLERMPGDELLAAESELISDYNCSQCGPEPSVVEKTSRISKLPQILVVHFNRSTYASANFRSSKEVDIPLHIGLLEDMQLRAVVYHRGNHYQGHYTAARRKWHLPKAERQRAWWAISDDSVKEERTSRVTGRTTAAYMLFYEPKKTQRHDRIIDPLNTKNTQENKHS